MNKFHILLFPVHFFPRAPSSLVRGLVAVAALRLLTRLSFPTRACRPVLVSIFDLAGCIAIAHTVNVKDGPVCRQQACWSCPKIVFAASGIPTVADVSVTLADLTQGDPLPRPYVIKPAQEGSSVGVKIIMPGDNLDLAGLDQYGALMAEDFVAGRELTVSVLQTKGEVPRALAVTELKPKTAFYDYEAKYNAEAETEHVVNPSDLPADVHQQLLEWSERAHLALGCRGASRADYRFDPDSGRIAILEVNTQPGLTPLSLLPEQALATGMDFKALVAWMVENAECDA